MLLLDAARFPRDKICGESVSPEAWRLLDALGATDRVRSLSPHPVLGMRLVSPDGTAFRGEYRGPRRSGFAVRRLALDQALLEAARDAGAEVREGTRVTDLVRDGARSAASSRKPGARSSPSGPGPRSGPTAGGAWSPRSLGLLREHPRMRRFAVRGHWEGMEALGDVGEMHVGVGGYCGVAPLSSTLANVAFVLGQRQMASAGGDLEAFYRDSLRRRWPRLAERLERARLVARPCAIGPLALECRGVTVPGSCWWGMPPGSSTPSRARGSRSRYGRPSWPSPPSTRCSRGPRASPAPPPAALRAVPPRGDA